MSDGESPAAPARSRLGIGFWAFIVLMLALTGLFVELGLWQVQRLAEKETLIAAVAERIDLPPVPLPAAGEWVGFDPEVFDYRPVTFSGHFLHEDTVLVFTSLGDPKGKQGGPGYWVMAPFAVDGGGTIFVNRGFVPERLGASFADGGAGPNGPQTITGIARKPEVVTSFTPGPDLARRIEWVRDVERLSAFVDPGLAPFAPVYVDLPAGDPEALPQGGETTLSFPNNHLGYLLTWFGFAMLTPVLLTIWIVRQVRVPSPQGIAEIVASQTAPDRRPGR